MKLRVAFLKWLETGYEMVIFDKNRGERLASFLQNLKSSGIDQRAKEIGVLK